MEVFIVHFSESYIGRMKVVQLDVTNKKQIQDALQFVTEQLNGEGKLLPSPLTHRKFMKQQNTLTIITAQNVCF